MPQSVIKKGLTTIFWGTDALAPGAAGTIGVAIVISATYKPHPMKGYVEGGNGSTRTTVLLDDGFDCTIECVEDTAITWPLLGDVLALKAPTGAATYNCLVVNSPITSATASRKKEATVTIELEYRPDEAL